MWRRPGSGCLLTASVFIVGEYPLFLAGMSALLDADPRFEVVGGTGNLELCAKLVAEADPALILVGPTALNLDVLDGQSSVVSRLRAAMPETGIVCITHPLREPHGSERAVDDGADGVISVESDASELLSALSKVSDGDGYVSPSLALTMIATVRSLESAKLTRRQVEILRMTALGHTSSEIAQLLSVSVRTVESHRAEVHSRLGTRTRAELVRYALDNGVIA